MNYCFNQNDDHEIDKDEYNHAIVENTLCLQSHKIRKKCFTLTPENFKENKIVSKSQIENFSATKPISNK